ncbi:MAG TPA: thiamine pyrophosphate-dependent dehydrogenase E1 component subunit alpha [Longimicrobiales bacterium]|nr:thiamine pyrophosphate-dependent dehydrogenase E1 component subunit alpha [Longimicrobiales bacterium]
MAETIGATQGTIPLGLSRDQLIELYYHLRMTREVEQVLVNLYRQNKVIGGLYRSLGQEATAVGSAYALRRRSDGTGDMIAPAIRNLGSLMMMGATPVEVMRQYMAKGDSPTWGREQNVHFTDYDKGYIGLISHLGVMIEIMCGVAMTFRLRGEDRVALTWIGDGASSTGAFHEGFNLAAVKRAPLVVIVENNGYAYSTPVARQTAAESFVAKAAGYGVYGDKCDGNDVFAVLEMTRKAVAHARAGNGAALLEVMTYRRKGHAEHDAQAYVPAGELDEWVARDPVDRYVARITDEGWVDRKDLDEVDERVRREVDAAREQAEASPLPQAEEALAEVYGGSPARAPWTRLQNPDPHEA